MRAERLVAYRARDTGHPPPLRTTSTALAAVVLMILTTGPSITLSRHFQVPLGWERWPYLVPMGGAALLGVFLFVRDLTPVDLRPFRVPLIAVSLYSLWSLASVLWSVAPGATATRATITAGVTCFGLWFGIGLHFKEQVVALYAATVVLTVSSFALVVLKPHEYQVPAPPWLPRSHTSALGVFGNPNSLGPVAALAVLTSIAMIVIYPTWRVWCVQLVTIPIGVDLVIWSRCETAVAGLAACIAALLVVAALPVIRRIPGYLVATIILVASIIGWRLFFDHIARIAAWVGGDPTLSSRRVIWHDVRAAIALRPWRGYGFFAYWDSQSLTALTYQRVGKAYGSAHNSILEVALGLGLVGLIPYLAMIGYMMVGIARSMWRSTSVATVAWSLTAIFLVIQNSMESFVLWHSYLWALFVAASLASIRLTDRSYSAADAIADLDGPSVDLPPTGESASEPAMAEPR